MYSLGKKQKNMQQQNRKGQASKKEKPTQFDDCPGYFSGNVAWTCCLVTCQLLTATRVGRPRFLSQAPVCQIAFGLSGWHSVSLT
jgi:hypothetical protein